MENQEVKPNLAKEPSPLDLLEHRLAETDRLGRFFSKLIGEVLQIQADEVEFIKEGESLAGSINRGGAAVKSLTIRAAWLPAIVQFLGERFLPVLGQKGLEVSSAVSTPDLKFDSALRVGDRTTTFKVTHTNALSGKHRLKLSGFNVVSDAKAFVVGESAAYARDTLERVLYANAGTVLLSAPDTTQLQSAVASFQALGVWKLAGDVSDKQLLTSLSSVATNHAVIITTIAGDVAESLKKFLDLQISASSIKLSAILCSAFARKCCGSCSKKAVPAPNVIAELPPYLQNLNLDRYVVGRGCDACGQTGFQGTLPLYGIVPCDDDFASLAIGHTSIAGFVEKYSGRGMRPLLEDGVRKALSGLTTFEAVLQVSRNVLEEYKNHWRSKPVEAPAEEPAPRIDVKDDFFDQGRAGPSEKPLVAKAIYSATPVEAGSEPLFGKKAARRDRALVLIVEDDADQRAIVDLALKGANYDVIEAANGAEALKQLESGETPDIIISDLMMPVMDGSELVMRVKSNPRFHRIPILMLTVVADEEREYALLDLGADDYCDKTIQRKLLLKRIEKLVKRG